MKGKVSRVIDVHYHLLFGLDDGPAEIEGSLELAQASIEEGVTHIVATPHANDRYPFQPEVNRERLAMLQDRVGDKLTLGLGCDFHLSYDNIEVLHRDPAKYCINGKRYLLVEFPEVFMASTMDDVLYRMALQGITPIITHPERNAFLQVEPYRMDAWVRRGYLLQVTGASLTGRFGRRAQELAIELVKKNWAHLVASDAHSVKHRSPSMRNAYNFLEENAGEETARRLCIENPRAVFYGDLLPPQPEPEAAEVRESKRGFFARLFGR